MRYSELRLELPDATLWLANAHWDLELAMAGYLQARELEEESTGLSEVPSDLSPSAKVKEEDEDEEGEEGEEGDETEEDDEESEVSHSPKREQIVADDDLGRREQSQSKDPNGTIEHRCRPLSSNQRPTRQ